MKLTDIQKSKMRKESNLLQRKIIQTILEIVMLEIMKVKSEILIILHLLDCFGIFQIRLKKNF